MKETDYTNNEIETIAERLEKLEKSVEEIKEVMEKTTGIEELLNKLSLRLVEGMDGEIEEVIKESILELKKELK